MKLVLSYSASTLLAVVLFSGFILMEMPLSDPEVFSDSLIETLAFAVGMIIVGLVGTVVLRNVYKQHRTYRRILFGILGFPLLVIGISGMEITMNSSTMPYLIFGVIFGFIDAVVGSYLFIGKSLMG